MAYTPWSQQCHCLSYGETSEFAAQVNLPPLFAAAGDHISSTEHAPMETDALRSHTHYICLSACTTPPEYQLSQDLESSHWTIAAVKGASGGKKAWKTPILSSCLASNLVSALSLKTAMGDSGSYQKSPWPKRRKINQRR